MAAIDDLSNLPLSHLFSAPLIAALDATLQAQSEKMAVLLETGFDENGDLVVVAFDYTTSEIDPETGDERRVVKRIDVPLLLFLSLPELVVHEIEETFSARITEVEETERERDRERRILPREVRQPSRLKVAPSGKTETFARKTQETYDLDIRMVAEVETQSTGMETLERAVNTGIFETVNEEKTEQLESGGGEGRTITPGEG